jgi:hypothetical protein
LYWLATSSETSSVTSVWAANIAHGIHPFLCRESCTEKFGRQVELTCVDGLGSKGALNNKMP